MRYKVKVMGFGGPFQAGALLTRGRKSNHVGPNGESGYIYTAKDGQSLLFYDNEVIRCDFKEYIDAL